ncbi:MAG: hypothetical protein AAF206_15070 [Bacteroidota bacterium]
MENEKDTWIEEVMNSMHGSRRAKPRDGLFSDIERQLDETIRLDFRKRQWRMLAAAVVLLFVVNAYIVFSFTQNNSPQQTEYAIEGVSSQSLVSGYNLYE